MLIAQELLLAGMHWLLQHVNPDKHPVTLQSAFEKLHVLQEHCELHVWVPEIPLAEQLCAEPGVQIPWLEQMLQSDHAPLLHVLVCAPQFPHALWLSPAQGLG